MGTDHAQLDAVVRFWNMAPISNRYLDYHDCYTWPDPWTLVDTNDFDDSSTSLGMFYTLLLSDGNHWDANRIKLAMLRNDRISKECLACVVDDRWLLGYDISGPVDMHDDLGIRILQYYAYDTGRRKIVEVTLDSYRSHVAVA